MIFFDSGHTRHSVHTEPSCPIDNQRFRICIPEGYQVSFLSNPEMLTFYPFPKRAFFAAFTRETALVTASARGTCMCICCDCLYTAVYHPNSAVCITLTHEPKDTARLSRANSIGDDPTDNNDIYIFTRLLKEIAGNKLPSLFKPLAYSNRSSFASIDRGWKMLFICCNLQNGSKLVR